MEPEALAAHLQQAQGVCIDAATVQAYAGIVSAACTAVRQVASTSMQFEDEASAFTALIAREEGRS